MEAIVISFIAGFALGWLGAVVGAAHYECSDKTLSLEEFQKQGNDHLDDMKMR